MSTNTNTAANVPATIKTSQAITLKEGTTHKGLKQLQSRKELAAIRKETNEAKKAAIKEERDERRKLSFHFKQLRNFASNYISLLSKETGKQITVDDVQALKYSDFLPFLTEREESSNLINGWTFSRLLNVVARYYRNEAKNVVSISVLSEIE